MSEVKEKLKILRKVRKEYKNISKAYQQMAIDKINEFGVSIYDEDDDTTQKLKMWAEYSWYVEHELNCAKLYDILANTISEVLRLFKGVE